MTLPYQAGYLLGDQKRNIIRVKIGPMAGINLTKKLATRVAVLRNNATDQDKRFFGDVRTFLRIRQFGYEEG